MWRSAGDDCTWTQGLRHMLIGAALLFVMQLFFTAMAGINILVGFGTFFSNVEDKPEASAFFLIGMLYGILSVITGIVALGILS